MDQSDRENHNTFGLYDAKTHFSELVGRVESGEEITITRHGMPVMKWVPAKRKTTPAERRAAFAAMDEIARKNARLTPAQIKELITRGRR